MYLVHKLVVLSTASNFLSFFLSVIIIFKKDGEFHQLKLNILRFTSLLFWFYSLSILFFNQTHGLKISILYVIAQLILFVFFWINTKYVKDKFAIIHSKLQPQQLTKIGPYKLVRHPFYSTYMVCYVLTSLYTNTLIIWSICLLLLLQYISAAREEETIILLTDKKNDYLEYRKNTWMFIPYIF